MGPLLLIIFTLLPVKATSRLVKILDPLGISDSPFMCLLLMNIVLIFCFLLRSILMANPLTATLRDLNYCSNKDGGVFVIELG